MTIDLSIHSFSLWHHFAHAPEFGPIAYIDLAEKLGFTGINLSLNNPNYRHLGGKEPWRMDEVRTRLADSKMSLEIDTSGTDPNHMKELLNVAHRMNALSLRTYTRHTGTVAEMMQKTTADLKQVVAHADQVGVTIVLENHEDFTGPELAEIVNAVNHPRLKILYDYGNSQMVLEDPERALGAVLPHVHSVHIKDHVMVSAEDAGHLTVAGVPMGEGFLPIQALTRRLYDAGLRRFTFENVWAYSARIQLGRVPQDDVNLGKGSFRYLKPPFDPARIILDQTQFSGAELVRLEGDALLRGLASFENTLAALNISISRQISKNLTRKA
jgi:3-oxoisoapionate decarboxylase